MRTTKATLTIKGVDTYFIPAFWLQVYNVFLIPVEIAQVERKKKIADLKKYSIPFEVLPPDRDNKANPVQRRLKLRIAPEKNFVIVSDIDIKERN